MYLSSSFSMYVVSKVQLYKFCIMFMMYVYILCICMYVFFGILDSDFLYIELRSYVVSYIVVTFYVLRYVTFFVSLYVDCC